MSVKSYCRIDGCRKRHHTLLYETKKVIASQSIAEEEVAQNSYPWITTVIHGEQIHC